MLKYWKVFSKDFSTDNWGFVNYFSTEQEAIEDFEWFTKHHTTKCYTLVEICEINDLDDVIPF